nr:uncharacterized protein LOC109161918 [Ipomoea trifida]
MATRKQSMPDEADKHSLHKEWDEASCPICMDHPHNAVLLLCSSHDKGCRSYICDTSYRHSNCLDRFKKVTDEKLYLPSPPTTTARIPSPPRLSSSPNFTFRTSDRNSGSRTLSNSSEAHEEVNISVSNALVTGGVAGGSEANRINLTDNYMDRPEATDVVCPSEPKLNLNCPLCRGDITGWKVVGEARKYLNLKPRNCSRESCSFVGNYRELRHHARRVHPTARPTDVDPLRQRAWRSLEEQREYDDIISAIRTAMPGAMVFGDYVIENGDRLPSERGTGESGRLMSTLFLFQMIGSMDTISELRSDRSRTLSRHRRSSGSLPRRRFLWESILSKIFSQLTSPSSQKPASLSEGRSISISFSSYRQGYALIQTK